MSKQSLSFILLSDTCSQKGHSVSYMTILFSMLANHLIRHQAKCKVGCQLGDRGWPFNLPQGFVWVCMGKHTHFITPEGYPR